MQPQIRLHGDATPPVFDLRAKHTCSRCAKPVAHYDVITIENGKTKRTYLQCPLCKKDIAENYPCKTCKKMVKDVTTKLTKEKETRKEVFVLTCNVCNSELLRLPGEYKKT